MTPDATAQARRLAAKAILGESSKAKAASIVNANHAIWRGDTEAFLKALP